ncbi:MAG: ComF family protein [Candidatus Omnitrophica bacterium]|nr:ComF family protein [Candidatus Omnitrophota bacterium]
MKKFIVKLIIGLKDIIYPKTCLICKQDLASTCVDELVCVKCWASIKKNTPPFCHRCGRNLDKESLAKTYCSGCLKNEMHFDRAFAPCIYEGPIKELIHEFKYRKIDYLAATLSGLMVDFIREYDVPMSSIDVIIPVPLHPARLREREFNQAELLAGHIAPFYTKIVSTDNLVRLRHTRTQAELQGADRLENVKDSFSVKMPDLVKGKNILLIDDVLTTGATASEASRALKSAGANSVFVLTLAN